MANEQSAPAGGSDTPIQEFSRCHEGIIAHLGDLDRLPALSEAASQARRIAEELLRFYEEAVIGHHQDEERELFPAVQRSAAPGEETERVRQITQRLTDEHRRIEAAFERLEPELKRLAKGRDAELDAAAVQALVSAYADHARFEETEFLPLAKEILGRDSHHMAALGLSLHMRHTSASVRGYI